MCGRFTVKMTWAEIVALYRLTLDVPPHNLQPHFNVCPTGPIDVVTEQDGKRDFVRMRWGLVPSWWPKPLKELRGRDVQCEGGDARAKQRKENAERPPPLGQRFRSGGAGAELWGLFGASRSKPLAEGWR